MKIRRASFHPSNALRVATTTHLPEDGLVAEMDLEVNDDLAELKAIEKERAEQSRRKSLGVTSPQAVRAPSFSAARN